MRKIAGALAIVCVIASAQDQKAPPRAFELKAESPKFWNLIAQRCQTRKDGGRLRFHRRARLGSPRLPVRQR